MRIRFSAVIKTLVALVPLICSMRQIPAQVIVPVTGIGSPGVTISDPKWNYIANLPKSSQNDGQTPARRRVDSSRWFDPEMRGGARRGQRRDAAGRHPRQ